MQKQVKLTIKRKQRPIIPINAFIALYLAPTPTPTPVCAKLLS